MGRKKDWKKRRKRILRRKLLRAAVLLVMLFMVIGMVALAVVGVKKLAGLFEKEKPAASDKVEQIEKEDKTKEPEKKEPEEQKDESTPQLVSNTPQKLTREQSIAQITKMAETYSEMQEILEHQAEYPDELLLMLANNPETLEFVKNYPKLQGTVNNADQLKKIREGSIPLLIQWDERWGYGAYGDSNIAISGCGPTCLAMVAAGLRQDTSVTPLAVANYAQEQGYYSEAGTSWDLMTTGCEQFGIRGEELALGESSVKEQLESGHPIICSMGPGTFTTEGHYIVLSGWKNGMIEIHDPNSVSRSKKLWAYGELEPQIKNMWVYSVK